MKSIGHTFQSLTVCAALVLLLSACGNERTSRRQSVPSPEKKSAPLLFASPEAEAEYKAAHYWDGFDFRDTALIDRPETERMLAGYLVLLGSLPQERRAAAVRTPLEKASASPPLFAYFCYTWEKYLHDPNSPLRNEELYIPVLEAWIASPSVPELEKERPRRQLAWALKNRPGEKAADFTYTLPDGRQGRLRDLQAEYLLLYFYNPGCAACREIRDEIGSNPLLSDWIGNGKVKVLGVYPDRDIKLWEKYLPEYPSEWILSRDATGRTLKEKLYDLKAIPTLYLLDADKKVLLRDASVRDITVYLARQAQ